MMKAIHCDTQKHTFEKITDIEKISKIRQNPDAILWLDMINPSESDLVRVAEEFQLHPLAIEDATHENQRPKLEEYEQFYLAVFYTVNLDEKTWKLDLGEIDMFLGQNFLITVHNKPLAELEEVERRWTRNTHKHDWGIGVLFYSLLDTIVDRYFPVVDAMVDRAEDLEDRLFTTNLRKSSVTMDILELKKQFLALRRIAAPERDVLNILTNRDNPLFSDHVILYFRDVYDHITRLTDTLDLYRDQLSSAMDANLSISSNDLNKVMRTLTVTSIILMANALIAGIYGMNFTNMPELHLQYGYYGALGGMVLITVVLIICFKLLRWL